jgi:anti-sigma regulatory factor (Ser/Thr protein kinase)
MAAPVTTGRTVAPTIDAVAHCTEFATAQAREAGFSIARVREVELVVEEVVANICRYGYGDRLGNVELTCRRLDGAKLELEFIDYGQAFDILALPEPDLSVDIDQRDVGGIGVPVLRALVDHASYRREDDRNVLCVIVDATVRFGGDSAAS